MNVLLEDIKRKKAESARLAQQGKVKYEYDSDEETEGGTWEHKRYVQGSREARWGQQGLPVRMGSGQY